MEQDLNSYQENETDLYHFKLIHKNQKLNKEGYSKYQNWKQNAINYINKINPNNTSGTILLIEFCDNCCSYAIFSLHLFSLIECKHCNYEICLGCRKCPLSDQDYSTCIKGFLIACYLRAFNESTGIIVESTFLYTLHIIFSPLITPLYFGFIFTMLGFLMHQNKSRLKDNGEIRDFTDDPDKLLTLHIFSIIKGLLFFPYIITFFPFVVFFLLLPGIFSKQYYLKVFTFYFNVVIAGGENVKNKYW